MEMVMQPAQNGQPGMVVTAGKNYGHHERCLSDSDAQAQFAHLDRESMTNRILNQGLHIDNRNAEDRHYVDLKTDGFRNIEATKDALKDLLINANQNACMINNLIKDGTKEVLVAEGNHFAALQLEAERNKAMLQLEAEKNKACLQLEMAKSECAVKAAIAQAAKEAAECCCETKELIRESAHHTDDLLRKFEERNLRDEVSKLREELTALRVRATLAPQPVASACL